MMNPSLVSIKKNKKPAQVWLMLTDKCNLNCVYCYNHKRSGPDMTWETALKALDFIFRYTKPNTEIMLWGGEPFLAWDLMKRILDYYPNQRFGTSTNGTLVTSEIVDYLKKRGNFVVVLSIDGMPASQEKGRPNSNDKLGNIQLLKELDATVHIVAYDVGNLYDNVRYVVDKLGFKKLFISTAHGVDYSDNDKKLYEEAIRKVIVDWKKGDFELTSWGRYEDHRDGEIVKDKFCGAGVVMFAITTVGDLYPCDAFYGIDQYKMGNIAQGFDSDIKRTFEDIYFNRELFSANCGSCVYDGGCGGRMCLQENYVKNGSIYSVVKNTCEMLQIERRVVRELCN